MKDYSEMTVKQLLECIEIASEDAHAQAKKERWKKADLIAWLEGFAEQTDEAPSIAQEEEQTDKSQDEVDMSINGKTLAIEIRGDVEELVERKVTTYARSGRSWVRHGKAYYEVLEQDGKYVGVPWQD